ncbi:nitroreductase family protein [uncultured Bifidobacterium sp.]|uniref:nitroreductase family protein n=1 Tax=uncultured Bifidobacterium sp. TaxID=165187 RepID=UPI0028DCE6F2|nr:nitroreductase family protein [uncultured Bifidobacterium sp.]
MTARDNPTIRTLLERRSIRAFTDEGIDDDIRIVLEEAAQRAPSSQYLNDWSAIRITDPALRGRLADIGRQSYIAQAPLLYVFVSDEHRNALIARTQGVDGSDPSFSLDAGYHFTQSQNDAALALHAMETAANALGLGCVVLGSLLNDVDTLIDLLKLPELTYPVLGLAIGHPDQTPMLKPRLPRPAQFFMDTYPTDDEAGVGEYLPAFDDEVHHYYDLRHADRPVEAFSAQIAAAATSRSVHAKAVLPTAERQGFRLDS